MTAICPTITAYDTDEYANQIKNIRGFAERIHIDLMDGEFAPTKSPGLEDVWWPHDIVGDLHIMYQRPMDHLHQIIRLKPHLVVVHAEAQVHHMHFAAELHKHGIEAGVSILQDTPVDNIKQIMHSFDHVLVFSGHLGYHGGQVNLDLLQKVREIRAYHTEIEIGWDGGISADNVTALTDAGVSVLNVGGFVQKADDPRAAYAKLKALVSEREES
jgi:ribulose-phosphate 3-epimerase